ncbi:MAG TPA: class I SAM-dependent methyltransferase [Verrucomicrobiae bacterium]|jgi:predicted O-methyltransferase YrrM|nr:class I SAM-dependent methyltransferase [Verrucomicrobiae bacterium]
MAKQPLSYILKKNLGLTKMKRMAKEASFRKRGGTRFKQDFHHPVLKEGLRGHTGPTDISDHLSTLFFFTVDAKPKLIVELGTRGGESTRALLSAASVADATMLSVDIEDCTGLDLPQRDRWNFVKADDVAFAKKGFAKWCADKGLKPQVDVLFIDTSHFYEHTKQEIAAWTPLLSPNGTVLFHDTNMRRGVTARMDQSISLGIDNDRGVIRALEEFLGKRYDENRFFTDIANGFLVMHYAHCNGMTVMKKM